MLYRGKNAQSSFIKMLFLKVKQFTCLGFVSLLFRVCVSLKSEIVCFWQDLSEPGNFRSMHTVSTALFQASIKNASLLRQQVSYSITDEQKQKLGGKHLYHFLLICLNSEPLRVFTCVRLAAILHKPYPPGELQLDGWLSQHSHVMLSASLVSPCLENKGMVTEQLEISLSGIVNLPLYGICQASCGLALTLSSENKVA